MEFPNFNYAAKLFRIDRKQKTICRRLCAVRRRPGATRIAALVPRKTESRTVVRQLQVRGPKIEKNFKNRPTILIWRTRSWGNGGDLFVAKWSSSEAFVAADINSGESEELHLFVNPVILRNTIKHCCMTCHRTLCIKSKDELQAQFLVPPVSLYNGL